MWTWPRVSNAKVKGLKGNPVSSEVLAALVHSCTFPLVLLCPIPRASTAVSCARVWLQGSIALALCQLRGQQTTALPWLCCTCTGFTGCFHYSSKFLLHSRRDSLWQSWLEWGPGLAAGFWFRGVVRWSNVSSDTAADYSRTWPLCLTCLYCPLHVQIIFQSL